MNREVRNVLIRVARGQDIITYPEIGEVVGLNMENLAHRNELAEILGEINEALSAATIGGNGNAQYLLNKVKTQASLIEINNSLNKTIIVYCIL